MKKQKWYARAVALVMAFSMAFSALPAFAEEVEMVEPTEMEQPAVVEQGEAEEPELAVEMPEEPSAEEPAVEEPAQEEIPEVVEAGSVPTFAEEAPADPEPVPQVSIAVVGGTITHVGTEAVSAAQMDVEVGSTVTVTATDAETFAYWVNEFDAKLSEAAEYTFKAVRSTTVTAVQRNEGALTVEYLVDEGKGYMVQTVANASEIAMPALAYFVRPGYTADGWYVNGGAKLNPADAEAAIAACIGKETRIAVMPNYVRDMSTSVTVTVTNTQEEITGAGSYTINDVVTLTAPEVNADEQAFSYWKDEQGHKLSYSPVYKFYASKDITLTAVYGEDVAAEAVIEVTALDNHNGTVTFVSESTVPENCTIARAGLLVSTDAALAGKMTADNSLVRVGVPKVENTTAYRYTYTVKASKTVYVTGYLEYVNAKGDTKIAIADYAESMTPAQGYILGTQTSGDLLTLLESLKIDKTKNATIVICNDVQQYMQLNTTAVVDNLTFTDDGARHTMYLDCTGSISIKATGATATVKATKPGNLVLRPYNTDDIYKAAPLGPADGGTLNLENIVVEGFTNRTTQGGALNVASGTTANLKNVVIRNCSVTGDNINGGAIYNAGKLNMDNVDISGCQTSNGHAGAIYNTGEGAVLAMVGGCDITGNKKNGSNKYGDDIYTSTSSVLAVSGANQVDELYLPGTDLPGTAVLTLAGDIAGSDIKIAKGSTALKKIGTVIAQADNEEWLTAAVDNGYISVPKSSLGLSIVDGTVQLMAEASYYAPGADTAGEATQTGNFATLLDAAEADSTIILNTNVDCEKVTVGNITINGNGKTITLKGMITAGVGTTPVFNNVNFVNDGVMTTRAIYVKDAAVELNNCTFTGFSTASTNGAALYLTNSAATVRRCAFVNNVTGGTLGGAIYAGNASTLNLEDTTFNGNTAPSGGAIYLTGSGTMANIKGGAFIENGTTVKDSETYGGAVMVASSAVLNMYGTTVAGNKLSTTSTVSHQGGGLYINGGIVNLKDCCFGPAAVDTGSGLNNKCYSGKDIYLKGGTLQISGGYYNSTTGDSKSVYAVTAYCAGDGAVIAYTNKTASDLPADAFSEEFFQ